MVNHWAESMRLRLEESLRPLLPPGGPVALLDFPVYPNVGDSAIWLGAVATLRQLGMRTPHYACSFKTYSRPELARRLGDGTILLSGGGNFGDRYAPHQRFQQRILFSGQVDPACTTLSTLRRWI